MLFMFSIWLRLQDQCIDFDCRYQLNEDQNVPAPRDEHRVSHSERSDQIHQRKLLVPRRRCHIHKRQRQVNGRYFRQTVCSRRRDVNLMNLWKLSTHPLSVTTNYHNRRKCIHSLQQVLWPATLYLHPTSQHHHQHHATTLASDSVIRRRCRVKRDFP